MALIKSNNTEFQANNDLKRKLTISTAIATNIQAYDNPRLDCVVPGDFNGDGKTDFLVWHAPFNNYKFNLYTAKSDGTGFNSAIATNIETYDNPSVRNVPGDFNGDGKTDFLVWHAPFNNNRFNLYTAESDGTGFNSAVATNIETYWNPDVRNVPGDFNGDGKTDFLVWHAPFNNNRYNLYTAKSDGTGFNSAIATNIQAYDNPRLDCVVPGDFNGDGKIDILVWHVPFNNNKFNLYTAKSDGTGFNSAIATNIETYWNPDVRNVPGDFNGDGKTDFLVWHAPFNNNRFNLYTAKSDGTGFNSAVATNIETYWNPDIRNVPGDFNGDGKTDFLVWHAPFNNNRYNLYTAKSDGTGFNAAIATNIQAAGLAVRDVHGDFNGDGKIDILVWHVPFNNNMFNLYDVREGGLPTTTATATSTSTSTSTASLTPTKTVSFSPTSTPSESGSKTESSLPTIPESRSVTSTISVSKTSTITPSSSSSGTVSHSGSISDSYSLSNSASFSGTSTQSVTGSASISCSETSTRSGSSTCSASSSSTVTASVSPSSSNSASQTVTLSHSLSPSISTTARVSDTSNISISGTGTASGTRAESPSESKSITVSTTATVTPTVTPSVTATSTPAPVPSVSSTLVVSVSVSTTTAESKTISTSESPGESETITASTVATPSPLPSSVISSSGSVDIAEPSLASVATASPSSSVSATTHSSSSPFTKVVTDSPSLAVILGVSITAGVVAICAAIYGRIKYFSEVKHVDIKNPLPQEAPHNRPDDQAGSGDGSYTTQNVNLDDTAMKGLSSHTMCGSLWDGPANIAGVCRAHPDSAAILGVSTHSKIGFSQGHVRAKAYGASTRNVPGAAVVHQDDETIQDDMSTTSASRVTFSPGLVPENVTYIEVKVVGESNTTES